MNIIQSKIDWCKKHYKYECYKFKPSLFVEEISKLGFKPILIIAKSRIFDEMWLALKLINGCNHKIYFTQKLFDLL